MQEFDFYGGEAEVVADGFGGWLGQGLLAEKGGGGEFLGQAVGEFGQAGPG